MSKILIVDDSSTMRKVLMQMIRQSGLEFDGIEEAGDGAEAVSKLAEVSDVGLVLSDVNMPKMNGVDFVKAVREGRNSVPIIMVATEGVESLTHTALQAGANGYVTKPFTPDGLKAVLDNLAA